MWLGIGVLVSNLVAAGWGAVAWARKDARASIAFWPLLRVAQVVVVVQAVVGLLLVASGKSAPDGLHMVYGLAPLVISLVSEGMRVGVAQRELEEVDDLEALDRSAAGRARAPGRAQRDGRDDRRRAADPHARPARIPDRWLIWSTTTTWHPGLPQPGPRGTGLSSWKGSSRGNTPCALELALLKEAREFAVGAAEEFGLDSNGVLRRAAGDERGGHERDPPRLVVTRRRGPRSWRSSRATCSSSRCSTAVASCRGSRATARCPSSGRGLEFMRLLMDEVDVQPGVGRHLRALRQAPRRRRHLTTSAAAHAELGVVADGAEELVAAVLEVDRRPLALAAGEARRAAELARRPRGRGCRARASRRCRAGSRRRPAPSTTIVSGSNAYSFALTVTAPFAATVDGASRAAVVVVRAAAAGERRRAANVRVQRRRAMRTGYYAAP